MAKSGKLGLTYKRAAEYFFEKSTEDDYWEVIDGELIMHTPVAIIHQKFALFLLNILTYYIRSKGLCELYYNPAVVRLDEDNLFEPDIFFVSQENLFRIKEQYLDGAPDLIIEILSPSTAEYDKGWKFKKYEAFHVKELWLLDPSEKQWEFYSNAGKRFQRIEIAGDEFKSSIWEGFFLMMAWLDNFDKEDPFEIARRLI